ncbi:DNA recombination protein RmuC [Niabella beijingensis]|uniref:DNA recombination protein RmuC n=1 Tax=Niabella beijingensis TaxID=2872700 RepID=UPI001CBE814C|nr:DNA recombination protein RmuC [Niabella beijingensis]MBZ4191304.1 DNA recombination protein RmuC [Niabella beijingensis]
MESLYLLSGIIIGAAIGYLVARKLLAAALIPRSVAEELQKKIGLLEQSNASRLSREEIQQQYVSREAAELLQENIRVLQEELKDEKWAVHQHQKELLNLTREAEQKFSKGEVEERDRQILQLNSELVTLKEKEAGLKEKLELFATELEKLHQFSHERFKTLAADVLEEKKKTFLDENKKELSTILEPLRTNLDQFREKVEATRKEDIQELTSLKKEIELLQQLNVQLSDDAKNLATALKSEVKMQGNWGEDRLNMILEAEGLQQYIDYTREEVYRDAAEENIRRPDFVLKLPNGKHIIIDSKVSLTAYVNYFNAADLKTKQEQLRLHIRSVTDHIEKLADKNYQTLAGLNTPDYVFLFMPVESALTLALNQHPDLFEQALKRKIVLITPTTLVATLKVVKLLWQKENQVKNVEEIFRQCGELYNKFVLFLEEMDRVEGALTQASRAHRDAMNHLKEGTKKGNTIIGRFERIRNLEAKVSKQIPGKYLTGLELLPDDDGGQNPGSQKDAEASDQDSRI